MRALELIAPALLAIALAGFSTQVGAAQAPDLECTQLSNTPDDGTPLTAAPTDLASKKVHPSQAARHRETYTMRLAMSEVTRP
jgi:hypothetical protein